MVLQKLLKIKYFISVLMMCCLVPCSVALAETGAQEESGSGFMWDFLVIAGFLAIAYFLCFLPHRRQVKAHQKLIASLKLGDEVVAGGGVIGHITKISDREVSLRVDEKGTEIRILKSMVSSMYAECAEGSKVAPSAKDAAEGGPKPGKGKKARKKSRGTSSVSGKSSKTSSRTKLTDATTGE